MNYYYKNDYTIKSPTVTLDASLYPNDVVLPTHENIRCEWYLRIPAMNEFIVY